MRPPTIYLKLENLQPIGSFKIRGAANVMARTPRERLAARRAHGLRRQHGAGRRLLRARAWASPPPSSRPTPRPQTKIRAVERLGGRVILAPFADWWRTFETRSYPGVDATFIHAFDDPDVMAGNGTIALELLEDLPDWTRW